MPTSTKSKKEAAMRAALMQTAPPSAKTSPPASSHKRKRKPGEQRFYAVRAGKIPGVYMTWAECQAMTNGFSGANYKSFPTREEAELYAAGKNPNPGAVPSRFYAVAIGNKPGIYTEWTDAQAAYTGVKAPKYKKFDTLEAAEAWLKTFPNGGPSSASKFEIIKDEAEYEDDDEESQPSVKKVKMESDEVELDVSPTFIHSDEEDLLEIYTDGSTLSNGQQGASAGVGVFFGENDPRNLSERLEGMPQTNQRAELTAILRALHIVPTTQGVQIWSDSKYAINCVTEWFVKWEKNGWRTHKGPVQNRDLVEAVLNKIRERQAKGTKTLIKWVKGHSSTPGNIAADSLAVDGAHEAKRRRR